MGFAYKLQPEIKEFILEKKKTDPRISCRRLEKLISEMMKVTVSKSSINEVFKEAGLSLPVGRVGKEGKPSIPPPVPSPQGGGEPIEKPLPLSPPPGGEPLPISPPLVGGAREGEQKEQGDSHKEPDSHLAPFVIARRPHSLRSVQAPADEAILNKDLGQAKVEDSKIASASPRNDTPSLSNSEAPQEVRHSEAPRAEESKPKLAPILTGPTTGAILLRAVDYLIGGISSINSLVSRITGQNAEDILDKTEALAYARLLSKPPYSDLSEEIFAYLTELQKIPSLPEQIYQLMPALFKEARGVKVVLSNGTCFYFDSQLHTVWSSAHIPFDFAETANQIKGYLSKTFRDNKPFIFFLAPGYDTPIKEFFELILSLNSPEHRSVSNLTLYGNKLEDLDVIRIENLKKQRFIFGLWPWQFAQYRKVNKIKEFKPFYFEPLKQEFFLAEVEVDLVQQHSSKAFTLRGCALKSSLSEKIRLIVLSNYPEAGFNPQEICNAYLEHWPNLEEAFQDYSRKIELFTYTAGSQRIFPAEGIEKFKEPEASIDSIFTTYLKMLDLYLRWHFFPQGYENKDFSAMTEQVYNLEAEVIDEKGCLMVNFKYPAEFLSKSALEYAFRRLNEMNIISPSGKRIWFR